MTWTLFFTFSLTQHAEMTPPNNLKIQVHEGIWCTLLISQCITKFTCTFIYTFLKFSASMYSLMLCRPSVGCDTISESSLDSSLGLGDHMTLAIEQTYKVNKLLININYMRQLLTQNEISCISIRKIPLTLTKNFPTKDKI